MPTLRRVRDLNDRTPGVSDYLLTDPPTGTWGRSTIRQVVGNAAFVHTQSTPATTWVINHNLGYMPQVQVFNSGSVQIEANIVHNSTNQLTVQFSAPTAGFARMV